MTEEGQTETVGKRWRALGYGLLAAIGVYALGEALRLGLWRQGSPGEGLFPFLTAMGMTAFAALCLAGVLRQAEAPARARLAGELRATLLRIGAYLAALLFYATALDPLGFIISTIVTVVFILRFAERYAWTTTIALAAGTAAGCHLLFVYWLQAILPTGYLWDNLLY
jgi:putative tricarboxylic transport membrane protein